MPVKKSVKSSRKKGKTYMFNGLPRVDAKKPIVLTILAKDVKAGIRKDPWGCAAAVACKRQFHAESAAVGKSAIHILSDDGTHYIRYNMPPSLKKEAHGFDVGGAFSGGQFQLSPFPKSKKLGIHQGTKTRPKKPTGNKRPSVRHFTASVRGRPENHPAY